MSKKKAKFVVNNAVDLPSSKKRSKHASLGKLSLSGRSKNIDKRKNTLLLEYKMKNKDNIFLDRRIGEKNRGMSQEEKIMARFTAEKIKAHSKKSIYNLNDDEILTHRGQSLMEIEKFDDPRSDDDEDDDQSAGGNLDKKFIEEAHFGGGVLSKASANSEMSRKDMINQLIAESKKRKAEKQKLREETIGLTEKLDTEWRDLMPLLSFTKKGDEEVEKSGVDDYTKELQKMKFEPRGVPTDRLKSEEEVATEEMKKLEELERSRQDRMKGFSDDVEFQQKHRSADDLDDFNIEKIEDEGSENENDLEAILKKYQESKVEKSKSVIKEEGNSAEEEDDGQDEDCESEEEEEEQEEEEQEEKEKEEEEKEEEEKEVKAKNNKESDGEKEESNDQDEDASSENEESESEDNLSDLKASDSSEEEGEDLEKQEEKKVNNIETQKNLVLEENLIEKDELIEKARKELPKTFEAPNTYEELLSILQNQSCSHQSVIVERIIKCNHWKLGEGNREKLSNLFSFLIKYLDECASKTSLEELHAFFQLFDKLCPHLYDLVHANPLTTKNFLHDILKEKHTKFEEKIKVYPDLSTIILFKLVSILYPTSDFRHPIVTPCLVFMSQILLRCKIKSKSDISKGLFLCTLMLEYTLLSKRWSPSTINFLRGVIYVSLPKPFGKVIKVIPPYKAVGEISNILVLEESHKKSEVEAVSLKSRVKDLIGQDVDDNFKLRTFNTAVNLLCEFVEQCSELDAAYSIFEPILVLLESSSVKRYPKCIRERVDYLKNKLEELKQKSLEYLSYEKKKPKALRMYEPRVEVIYDGKRHKPMSREKAERAKLIHKLKRETKSARRELRRDNAFLSKVKIKQQIVSDNERKRKVKEIFGDAAVQQHELKKYKKKK